MTTKLKLTCDCGKELELGPIKKEFRSFSGRGYGFGQWNHLNIDEIVDATRASFLIIIREF